MDTFFIAIVLLLLSLLAHGFWVGVTKLFRAVTANEQQHRPNASWCRQCRIRLEPHHVSCPSCGHVPPLRANQYRNELESMRRQVMRFRDDGTLSREETDWLLQLVDNERRELIGQPPAEVAHPWADTIADAAAGQQPASTPDTVEPRASSTVSPVSSQDADDEPLLEIDEDEPEPLTAATGESVEPTEPEDIAPQLANSRDDERNVRDRERSVASLQAALHRARAAQGRSEGDSVEEPAGVVPARTPRQSFGDLLSSFMESKNIRWGELISSMLVVVSSVGLVISLWSTIERIRYFPALLFMTATVAIHSAGLYTLKRWKLESTSRGLLTIAALLIPLNFAAAIALSGSGEARVPVTDPMFLLAIAVGLAVFGATAWSGAKTLSHPFAWWPQATAVYVPAIVLIFVNRTVERTDVESGFPGLVLALATVAFAGLVVPVAGQVLIASRWSRLNRRRVIQLFRVPGLGAFSLAITVGFLCWRTGEVVGTLAWLSPLFSLSAAAILATGLVIHSRLTQPSLTGFRTGGTALAVLGGLLMVSSIGLAWPNCGLLITVGLINFIGLTLLGWKARFPQLHVVAWESFSLAAVIGFYVASGLISADGSPSGLLIDGVPARLTTVLLQGRSGLILQLLALAAVAIAAACRTKATTKSGHGAAKSYAIAAALLLVASTASAGYAALPTTMQTPLDRNLATLTLFLNGFLLLGSAFAIKHPAVTWSGSALILAAACHAMLGNSAIESFLEQVSLWPSRPLMVALLIHGVILGGTALLARWMSDRTGGDADSTFRQSVTVPVALSALASSALSLAWSFDPDGRYLTHATAAGTALVVWLMSAQAWPIRPILAGAQCIGAMSVVLLSLSICQTRPDWTLKIDDSRMLLTVAAGWAMWSGVWLTLRRCRFSDSLSKLLDARNGLTVDRMLAVVSTVLVTSIVVLAALGEVGREMPLSDVRTNTPFLLPLLVVVLGAMAASAILVRPSSTEREQGGHVAPILQAVVVAIATGFLCAFAMSAPDSFVSAANVQGPEGLFAAAAVLALTMASVEERRRRLAVAGVLAALTSVMLQIAISVPQVPHTVCIEMAFALVLLGAALVPLAARDSAAAGWLKRVRRLTGAASDEKIAADVVTLFGAPVVGISIAVTLASLIWLSTDSDAPGRVPQAWETTGPILLLIIAAVATAIRLRSERTLLCASMLTCLAVSESWLVVVFGRTGANANESVILMHLVQVVAGTGAVFTVAWWLLDRALPLQADSAPVTAAPQATPETTGEVAAIRASAAADSETTVGVEDHSLPESVVAIESSSDKTAASDGTAGPDDSEVAQSESAAGVLPSHRIADARVYATPFGTQWTFAFVLSLIPAGLAALMIALNPRGVFDWVRAIEVVPAALSTLTLTALTFQRRQRLTANEHVASVMLGAAAAVVFFALTLYDSTLSSRFTVFLSVGLGWLALAVLDAVCLWVVPKTLTSGSLLDIARAFRSAVAPSVGRQPAEDESLREFLGGGLRWCFALCAAVTFMAVRGFFDRQFLIEWTVILLAGVSLVLAVPAIRASKRTWAYFSAGALLSAGVLFGIDAWRSSAAGVSNAQAFVETTALGVLSLGLAGLFWLGTELIWQRRYGLDFDPESNAVSVHRIVSILGTIVLVGVAAGCADVFFPFSLDGISLRTATMLGRLYDGSGRLLELTGWISLLVVGFVTVGSFWDRRSVEAIPCLFFLPLAATLISIDRPGLDGFQRVTVVSVALAFQLAASALLLHRRTVWFPMLDYTGIRNVDPGAQRTLEWMPHVSRLLIWLTVFFSLRSALTADMTVDRFTPAVSVSFMAIAFAILAEARDRFLMRVESIVVLTVSAVWIGWAMLPLEATGVRGTLGLKRGILGMEVLAVMTFALGVPFMKALRNVERWRKAVHMGAALHGVLALASLICVLVMEAVWFVPGEGAPVDQYEIGVVAVVLSGLVAGLIALAVSPRHDPLNLNDKQRQLYVYAAEAVGGLIFLHIYLTLPELFQGRFKPYWTLIVMLIAFFGAGIGEVLRRAGRNVLSEPLQKTGTFLPLLPALGVWLVTPRSELAIDYSTELFAAGLIYVFLAMWRKSLWFVIAAGIAGNAGLWAMWHEMDLELVTRPQLWLIPPALSVLVASHINRDRLSDAQLTAMRYASIILIYVSSTGEMFIAGVGESENLWLPIVLATLSIAGVLVGIMLRVRAFLYTGSSFLLLSVVSMVWHAQRALDQSWPWWAFGFTSGLALLTLFGLFEKRRNEMLKLLGDLRQWDQ